MTSKTLGIELNSIIEAVLIKKEKFEIAINTLNNSTSEKIESLESIIEEIENTIYNLNNTIILLENKLYELQIDSGLFLDDTIFYRDILPSIKNNFREIFTNYLDLFSLYESQIESEIHQKLDELLLGIANNRDYNTNVFNYWLMKENVDINNEYKKEYFIDGTFGNKWHSGKFYDDYLNKDVDGSLEVFHLKQNKNEMYNDFSSGNPTPIYENIIYHPDYGMLHYRSIGNNSNRTGFLNPENGLPNINFEIISDDEFRGEITELAGINNIRFQTNFSENQLVNQNHKKIKYGVSLSHVASNNQSIIKTNESGQIQRKAFLHKICVHEPEEHLLPSLFFIGQNKDSETEFTKSFTKSDNNTESFLNPYRRITKETENSEVQISLLQNAFESDVESTLNENYQIPSQTDLFFGVASSLNLINYRNNKISNLIRNLSPNSNSYLNTDYYYDDILHEFGSEKIIVADCKNNSMEINSYDFFSNYIHKIYQDKQVQHICNYNKYQTNNNSILNTLGLLSNGAKYHVGKQLKENFFFCTLMLQNLDVSLYENLVLRNDSRLNNYSLIERFINLNSTLNNTSNLPTRDNTQTNYNYLDYCDLYINPLKFERYWWRNNESLYNSKDKIISYGQGFLFSPKNNQNYYSIINSSYNSLNMAYIDNTDINDIMNLIYEYQSKILEEEKKTSFASRIGELIYIPYSIENPNLIFNNKFAKAGSVLDKKEYSEAYSIFGDKYRDEINDDESFNIYNDFVLPSFRDKYLIGADSTNIMEIEEDAIPKLDFSIYFDTDSNLEDAKFTGPISKNKGEIPYIGINFGKYGYGGSSQKIEISTRSKSPITKGNDMRVDIYIRVKD